MANAKLSIKASAVILASSTLLSALLGIFRDRLLNSYYLDTYPTGIDAYTAAFTVTVLFLTQPLDLEIFSVLRLTGFPAAANMAEAVD